MSKRVGIDGLSNEIVSALEEYTEEVTEELDKAKEEIAKESAETLKSTSPKKYGKYAKGWRAKLNGTAWVVHNSKRWQITHLLEKGHAKVNGGRVAAIPHIAPVEEQAIKEYEKRVEKAIKG